MRPLSLVLPPIAPSGLTATLSGGGHQPHRDADLAGQLHHRDVVPGAAVDQPRQHLDHHRDDPVAAERGQHPPDADLHRPVDVQPDHHDRATTASSRRTRSATWPIRVPADDGASRVSNTRVIGPSFTITASAGAGGTHLADRCGGRGPERQPDVHDHAERRLPHAPPCSSTASNNAGGGVDRHLHLHQRARPTTPSRHVRAEPGHHHLECRAPAAPSRRTARRRWRSTAARRTRSRRTPATCALPCSWTASTTRPQ